MSPPGFMPPPSEDRQSRLGKDHHEHAICEPPVQLRGRSFRTASGGTRLGKKANRADSAQVVKVKGADGWRAVVSGLVRTRALASGLGPRRKTRRPMAEPTGPHPRT